MKTSSIVFLVASGGLFLSSYLALANRHLSQSQQWAGTAVGMTSPIRACRVSACNIFHGRYPILYAQFTSATSLVLAFAEREKIQESVEAYRLIPLSQNSNSQDLVALKTGHSSTVVGFAEQQRPIIEYRIHLEFSSAMDAESKYRLEFPGQTLEPVIISYSDNAVSPSIQVNQVGYLPQSRKTAFVGNWLGDAGPMTVKERDFQVINTSTMATVFEGELQLAAKHDLWSGNDVFQVDFSALQEPGNYQIRVPGIGRSDTFKISADVYAEVFSKTFRYFYHSRNSTAIEAPYAERGYERPSGIPQRLSGFIHSSARNESANSNLMTSDFRPIFGGWFDAGDYGQYVVNAAPVWHFFSTGFDIDQNALAADNMNIPESGNGIPDMVDELEWGMNWLLDMQDISDGGVYSRLVPLRWDDSLPHEVNSRRYFFEKTTHATAAFAAAASIHSRLLRDISAEKSAAIIQAAERAWSYTYSQPNWPAEGDRYRNAKGVHAGEYPDKSSIDNRMWAAAELYRTTGRKDYYDAFIELYKQLDIDPTAYVSFKDQALAGCWALLMAKQDGREVDIDLAEELRKHVIASADWLIRKSDENPYRAAMHQYPGFTGWGSFAQSTRASIPLLQAYHLTGKDIYSERAKEMTNSQLGANPQSISYITGIGIRYPMHPLSKLSQFDDNEKPLPGIPVNGPHFHLPALWPSTKSVNNTYYPNEKISASPGEADYTEDVFLHAYPVLRRYVDAAPLPPMSEPTVSEYAQTVVAYGLLGSDRF